MMRRDEVPTPALLVDIDLLDRNIATMREGAQALGVSLRPHAKAHKCVEIAQRIAAAGAIGASCATIGEAEAMALGGIRGILVTAPFDLGRSDRTPAPAPPARRRPLGRRRRSARHRTARRDRRRHRADLAGPRRRRFRHGTHGLRRYRRRRGPGAETSPPNRRSAMPASRRIGATCSR